MVLLMNGLHQLMTYQSLSVRLMKSFDLTTYAILTSLYVPGVESFGAATNIVGKIT